MLSSNQYVVWGTRQYHSSKQITAIVVEEYLISANANDVISEVYRYPNYYYVWHSLVPRVSEYPLGDLAVFSRPFTGAGSCLYRPCVLSCGVKQNKPAWSVVLAVSYPSKNNSMTAPMWNHSAKPAIALV